MLRYARQVWYSKFARSVAIVASGTAAAQIITVAFSPIITRLYGPEAFGILGTFTALFAIMVPMAALSYPIAIVLPKNDSDAKGLIHLSIKLGFITSAFVALILLFAGEQIVTLLNIGEAAQFVWFIPLAMLLSVLLATASQWAVRKKLFKLKAKVAVANALIQNLLKSGVGLFAPFAWVLIVVTTLSSAINAALYYFGIRKERNEKPVYEQKAASQMQLAKQHGDFAYFRTPHNILNAASQSMPVLMLTALFGPVSAGYFVLSRMVIGAPIELIGSSVNTVFYPHFNTVIQEGRSGKNLLVKSTLALLMIGIIPFGTLILFGPWLFSLVFGNEWYVAGEFVRWLAIWRFVSFFNRPSVAAAPVLKLQGLVMLLEVISTILRVAALYFAYVIYGTPLSAVIWFSLVNVLHNLILIAVTIYYAGVTSRCSTKA